MHKKLLRFLFFSLIFLISLNLGFQRSAGKSLAAKLTPHQTMPQPTQTLEASVPTFNGAHQRNIMVIGVDRRAGNTAQLEAIWLMVYFFDSPEVNLISLFPNLEAEHQNLNVKMASNFALDEEGNPSEAFWQEMKARNILYHNFAVVDMAALWEIAQLMQIEDEYITGLVSWQADPQQAIDRQIQLAQILCHSFNQGNLIEQASVFINDLKPHITTNVLDWQIDADWQLLRSYGGHLTCLFPNLTITP